MNIGEIAYQLMISTIINMITTTNEQEKWHTACGNDAALSMLVAAILITIHFIFGE